MLSKGFEVARLVVLGDWDWEDLGEVVESSIGSVIGDEIVETRPSRVVGSFFDASSAFVGLSSVLTSFAPSFGSSSTILGCALVS